MLEIIFIIVGILIVATLFDKWVKTKSDKPDSPSANKINTQESSIPEREKLTARNSYDTLNKEIQFRQISADIASNDTEYKLYQAILYATKMVADHPEFRFNDKQIYELILFLYSYAFNKLYELAPELEKLIWMAVQCNVYMYLVEYGKKYDLENDIDISIGDFVNQRGELYGSEVDIIKSSTDSIPTKLIDCVFENPLNQNPVVSHDLTKYMKLRSILSEPFALLDAIGKKIIDTDFSFGTELKYKNYIEDFRKDNAALNPAHLKPVVLRSKECKKIIHDPPNGRIIKGRDFYKAAKSVKILETVAEEIVLVAAFILFDEWIDTQKVKYRSDSNDKEYYLLIEHQIVQSMLIAKNR